MRETLAYDDVLLLPRKSSVLPRDAVVESVFTPKIKLRIPFCSAAMDTVSGREMAVALAQLGGIAVLHRNMSPAEQATQVKLIKGVKGGEKACVDEDGALRVAAAVGVNDAERVALLVNAGIDALVVDTAHGHSQGVLDAVRQIKRDHPQTQIVAGNIVTAEAVRDLKKAGADAVKVGVGPGSICTTRVVAGVGCAQFSAVCECARAARGTPIIADGGIKYSGDAAKALAAGASSVMMGSLFAGTEEAPGEVLVIDGKKFKSYRGMGSVAAMMQGSKSRYSQDHISERKKLVPEGVEGIVPYKGSVAGVIHQMTGGVKAAMGYCGARDLAQFKSRAKFVRITNAGLRESHPHSITITGRAPNY
ncbi:guanosine monophosphate reductase [Candidatus Micrarchaeota archaeon CG1_02_60_51]|nr:MAG: guanosine monophosphate reductase [Candidatus Micrarchaeota archaeon CG1_02_60_51]